MEGEKKQINVSRIGCVEQDLNDLYRNNKYILLLTNYNPRA